MSLLKTDSKFTLLALVILEVCAMNEKVREADVIFQTSLYDNKIYVREQKGWWQHKRRIIGTVLMILFVALPWMTYKGEQAIYFDVGQQTLNLFALTLFPSDLFIFTLLFIFAAFALFYVTKRYGRVWCGFACPQTIWTLMFNWVERRVEGTHNKSKALDKAPMSTEKVVKKSTKHFIWFAISLFTSLAFMSYFSPARELYTDFFTLQTTSLIDAWVWFFAICTYVNAAWMKESMCQHVCPYSRFQSAMFDDSTYLVGYDSSRGEGRGKRRRGQEKAAGQGDCVDCDLCVQVCPVGIDIRDGLQYECISCGLCIDACDDTMDKFGYEKGLIKFDQIKSSLRDKKQNFAYLSLIIFTVVGMAVWFQQRIVFDLTVSRDRQALYRVNNDGHVENTYVIQIRNKTRETETYQLDMTGLEDISIIGDSNIVVKPGELKTTTIAVSTPEELNRRHTKVSINLTSESRKQTLVQDTSFYSGSP